MEDLRDCIKKSRSKLSDKSVDLYIRNIKKISDKIGGKEKLSNIKGVMNALDDKKLSTKKNYITSILVYLGCDKEKNEKLIKKYNDLLKTLQGEYNNVMTEQKKNPKQKKNSMTYEEIKNRESDLEKDVKHNMRSSKFDYMLLQRLVILKTYLDFPLRNDFCDMKVLSKKQYKGLSDTEKANNNFLVGNKTRKTFHINNYKTNKKHGNKEYEVSKELNKWINKLLTHNKSGYFLVKKDMETPISSLDITKEFYKIFKPLRFSTSMLRSVMISKDLLGKPSLKKAMEEAKQMDDKYLNSSSTRDLVYRKI